MAQIFPGVSDVHYQMNFPDQVTTMDQLEEFISLVLNQISLHPESSLEITSVDNPGWYLETTGKVLTSEGRVDRDVSGDDWIVAFSRDCDYRSAGDEGKLEMLIEAYNGYFGSTERTFQLPPPDFKGTPTSLLGRLVAWYTSYCDGYWEHYHGVTIVFLAPSTCKLKIELEESHLEGKVIPDCLIANTTAAIRYSVDKDVFYAEGSIPDFRGMLELFLNWAETTPRISELPLDGDEPTGGDA